MKIGEVIFILELIELKDLIEIIRIKKGLRRN